MDSGRGRNRANYFGNYSLCTLSHLHALPFRTTINRSVSPTRQLPRLPEAPRPRSRSTENLCSVSGGNYPTGAGLTRAAAAARAEERGGYAQIA